MQIMHGGDFAYKQSSSPYFAVPRVSTCIIMQEGMPTRVDSL